MELLIRIVKEACQSALVIGERDSFETYFKKSKNRKWGEEVTAYRTRRNAEYKTLVELNVGTALSQNLQNYLLLDGMRMSEDELLAVLRNSDNSYKNGDKIMEHLKVQFHEVGQKELDGRRQSPKKKFFPHTKPTGKAFGKGKGGGGYGKKGKNPSHKKTNFLQDMPSDDEDQDYEEDGGSYWEEEPEEEGDEHGADNYWIDSGDEAGSSAGGSTTGAGSTGSGFDRSEGLKGFQNFLSSVDLAL